MDFISDNVIRQLLRNATNNIENVKLIEWDRPTPMKPLIGFTSQCGRLVVKYQIVGIDKAHPAEVHLFIKAPQNPSNPLHRQHRQTKAYEKESHLYRIVEPQFRRFLTDVQFIPTLYYADDEYNLILQDLSHAEYRVWQQHEPLRLELCIEAVKVLAKFHAVSFKVHQTFPQMLDSLREELLLPWVLSQNGYAASCERRFDRAINSANPTFAREYEPALHHFGRHLLESAYNDLKPSTDSFNVLNHGDFLTTNILFKYAKDETIEDVKLIDFQHTRWSSPVVDLIYFVLHNVEFETFEMYFDLWLHIYADTLNDTLTLLKCDRSYDLPLLKSHLAAKYNYWIYLLIMRLPLTLANPEEITSSDMNDDRLFKSEHYTVIASKWLKYFIEKSVESSEFKVFVPNLEK